MGRSSFSFSMQFLDKENILIREKKKKKWDEDDLRTPVEDKNSNQALRIISRCFPFNYVQKYSLLSPQDVFVPLIKIFSLSRNCIEKKIHDSLRLIFSSTTMFSA